MRRRLFKHKMTGWGGGAAPYVSPYLLEVLSTRPGAPGWASATGALVANTGQVVSCSRASSAYCLGDDGLLHLLGANTVRVEPAGLLRETQSTNSLKSSCSIGDANWNTLGSGVAAPTVSLNTTDVQDPAGGNEATKLVYPAASGSNVTLVYQATGGPSGGALSIYLRTLSGTTTIYWGDGVSAAAQLTVTSSWQRFTIPLTGSGNAQLGFNGQVSIPGGTIYAWGAQAEATPFATSLIRTTSAAATRDPDLISVANPIAALSQPVAPWRWSGKHTALSDWGLQGTGGLTVLMDVGNNVGAGNARVLVQSTGVGTNCTLEMDYNASTSTYLTNADALGPTSTAAWLGTLAFTVTTNLTITPGTVNGQTHGALANPIQSTLYLGQSSDIGSGFDFSGHMTDLVMDNT